VTEFADTFDEIRGICVDTAGNAYVSERNNKVVLKFDLYGALLSSFSTPGDINEDIAVDKGLNMYVSGTILMQSHLWKFDPKGNQAHDFQTAPGSKSLSIFDDSMVFACGNSTINSYSTTNGSLMHSWPAVTTGFPVMLYDIALSPLGTIVVTDIESNQILVISANGELLVKGGAFADLTGLAIDKNGNLYGAESGKNRVVKIKYQ
jgi:DNA-binding beta-propeller fold protein YncE